MSFPSIFENSTTESLLARVENLHKNSTAQWGKMNVAQMLTHCCLPYKVIFGETKHKIPFIFKLFMKGYLKKVMTDDIPYKRNLPTAKNFIIADDRDFEIEKNNLKKYIIETEKRGFEYLENFRHPLIGYLTKEEWSNFLYKHLDHHFKQFGV